MNQYMKVIIVLSVLLSIQLGCAQELQIKKLLPPEAKTYSDLYFLEDELQGKQLVMLGELTHMYGNIFEMKARVIEYLHQQLGYTTIAMESSMYDIWKMNENGFSKKAFNEAIWGVWSGTQEFQRLVNYIEENNLKVVGFDSQVNNAASFVEDFFDYCEDQNIDLRVDEDDLGIVIEGVLANISVEEDDIAYTRYERELIRIGEEIGKQENNDTNYYWLQFTKSLLACSQDAYYNTQEIYTTDFGTKNDNIRDKQMADNLLSYIKRNPNEKIICWADNIHVINDNSSIKKPIANAFVSMGTHIKKALANKAYSLATIHANDSLLDLGTNIWHATPIKVGSFEEELEAINEPYLFVSAQQEAMRTMKDTRLLNYIDFTTARLDQLHDGYLFLKRATLPKKGSDDTAVIDKKLDLGKKIALIERGRKIVLKGQILDEESSMPIPFATLILKKEEIYRVADENGFYELPVTKTIMQNATVAISSMGFESSAIALAELHDKTYLKSKFEELNEVIVTGYLSPKTVLKKAITNKKINHPITPFNFYRYGNVLIHKDGMDELDLEIITKDYDDGYLSPYVISQRVEQIKWNKNTAPKRYKTSSQFFSYRQNAIRYSNILHKRKYKKFKMNFVRSTDPKDEGLYIISFETERDKWNYTNKGYPTTYSGRVYIAKENFAIVKVVENWETALKEREVKEHLKKYGGYDNIVETTIKEENICYYAKIGDNGKYYATRYFNRAYRETIDKKNKKSNRMVERDSYLLDFELNDVEEIEYFEYNNKKENSLYRVDYDPDFWNAFYKRKSIASVE